MRVPVSTHWGEKSKIARTILSPQNESAHDCERVRSFNTPSFSFL